MPRTLFGQILAHALLVLALFLGVSGFALDRFLADRELTQLKNQLERAALQATATLPTTPLEREAAVRRIGEATDLRITVVGTDGKVLADSHHDSGTMDNHADRPELAAALAGRVGASLRRSPTLGLEMLYVAVPGAPVVRTSLPLADVQALLSGLRRRVVLAAVPATLLAVALALLLSRSVTRRFRAMENFAASLAAGDYGATLPVQGADQVADLERHLVALKEELRHQLGTLEADRSRLQALVDGLPDAVVVLNGDGRFAAANEPAQTLLRLSAVQLQKLAEAEVFRLPGILDALDQFRAGGPGAPLPEPVRVSWPDPVRELEVTLRHLADEAGRPGVLVVLRDVTRQAHLEQVRTDFIANLSHELRTPLTAVQGAAETLLDGATEDKEVSRRFLETILRHSTRLGRLLSDVSDLACIEAGAATVEPQSFDAREPVHDVLDLFRSESEKSGVALTSECPDRPLPIYSDADVVEQILVNLVQNAVRCTPGGGNVWVGVERAGNALRYVVRDTGIGIPPNSLDRVTERFYRVHPGRSRAQGGTGLGLSIVKHLVEALGGTLTIESRLGAGTRVLVDLPSSNPA